MFFRRRVEPCRLTLLTRAGCHLCDEMAELLDRVLPEVGATWEAQDVDSVPEYAERWGETIPVLLRDGKAVAKVRVTRRQLLRIVRRRR